METSWLGGRVPLPDLEEMIEGALSPAPKPMGPNARFGYPLRGGFQALMDGFLPHLKGELRLNSRRGPGLALAAHGDAAATATMLPYEHLISTMPLPVLVRQMGDEAPGDVRRGRAGLRHVSVRCVHLGVGRENLTEKHWIYYPEDTVFHRIFVQGNASPHCNPPGGFGLTCEITYSPAQAAALRRRRPDPALHRGLPPGRLLQAATIRSGRQHSVDLPYAYVVYDHARAEDRAATSASGWPSTTSSSPAATASGSTTTPTTPSSRERPQLKRFRSLWSGLKWFPHCEPHRKPARD